MRNRNHPFYLTLLVSLLALLMAPVAFAASVSASIDRTEVYPGETFQLVLQSDDSTIVNDPDLSSLAKDFDVLDSRKQNQVSIINGTRSSSISWVLSLAPKSSGTLDIPPITIGQWQTQSLTISVSDNPQSASDHASRDVFLEASVSTDTAVVNGEVIYTLKLYDSVNSNNIALSEPVVEGATVVRHGDDRVRQESFNGIVFTVYARDYLVRPLRSGELRIEPATAQVQVPAASGNSPFGISRMPSLFANSGFGGSLFDQMMNPGQKLSVRSNTIALSVKARPDGTLGWFLPSSDVTLTQIWEPSPPDFRTGEAVTRRILLTAMGATAEQLPELSLSEVPGIKQYVDSSKDRTVPTRHGMASAREYRITVLPTQSGDITLPSVTIDWWNVDSETAEQSILPAMEISVAPATSGLDVASTITAESSSVPDSGVSKNASGKESNIASLLSASNWLILSAALLALFLMLALRRGWKKFRKTRTNGPANTQDRRVNSQSLIDQSIGDKLQKRSEKSLREACKASDATAAYNACLGWHRSMSADVNSSNKGENLNTLDRLIDELGEVVYAHAGTEGWNARSFHQRWCAEVSRIEKLNTAAVPTGVLPELYVALTH